MNKVLPIALLILAGLSASVSAQEKSSTESDGAPWNLKMKTLGGMQFWTDVLHARGWRIQQNAVTQHYRLIDQDDVRHAWGSRSHCDAEFKRQLQAGHIKLHRGRVIILLHGLARSHRSMLKLQEHFASMNEFEVINFEYATSQKSVADHADALHQIISGLGDNVTEINFVTHSLGALVVRHYLKDQTDLKTGRQGDSRIARTVMMGPPNQGSRMARILKGSIIFNTVTGVSGQQLSTGWNKLKPDLATPRHEFGIIAGGQESDSDLSNFMLAGKDDFTVRLAETRLVGATDLFVKPFRHSNLMTHPDSIAATERFIKYGYFVSPDKRNPITSLRK